MSAARPSTSEDYVAASYRYLRLAILVVVLTLAASLVLERYVDDCSLGSISAYYYTPVHSVFIGALIALGVIMIALRSDDALEDMLFNVAGTLAPIVALVPTSRPSDLCDENQVVVANEDLISNNVPALGIGLILAVLIAYLVARQQNKVGTVSDLSIPRSTWVGLAISVILIVIGVIWYFGFQDSFLRRAHGTTAITMFVFIWMAAMVNAGWPRPLLIWIYERLDEPIPGSLLDPTPRHLRYRRWYRFTAIYMPVAGVAVVLLVPNDTVFWLEVVEIAGFGLFWALQTFEAWETGFTSNAPAD